MLPPLLTINRPGAAGSNLQTPLSPDTVDHNQTSNIDHWIDSTNLIIWHLKKNVNQKTA